MTDKINYYKGTFKDDLGTHEIVVENDSDVLSVEIDNVRFTGDFLDDLEIIEREKYSSDQIKRFTFLGDVICNFQISVRLPQIILNKQDASETRVDLILDVIMGKPDSTQRRFENKKIKLSLKLDDELIEGYTSEYIDYAFDEIIKQFDDKYAFKNCYGCLFSDYSPYGQAGFGAIYCFVRNKEKYLNVQIPKGSYKYDYMNEIDYDYDVVQETHCCDKFQVRKPGTGYRG